MAACGPGRGGRCGRWRLSRWRRGGGAEQARQVGVVHGVVVDQDEFTDAEPGQELRDDRADPAEPSDGGAEPAEGFLAAIRE